MSEQKSHLKTFNTRQLKKVHYYNFETVASRQVSWMDQDNLAISNHLVSILTFEHVSVSRLTDLACMMCNTQTDFEK
jgi:hypothetical protein